MYLFKAKWNQEKLGNGREIAEHVNCRTWQTCKNNNKKNTMQQPMRER